MPWIFAIPEFVKKRACRYLLQHYLGQYLEEKIQLEDLTVDLYNGTGTINNVPLNVEAINDTLEGTGSPVQVVSGYLGRVTISVPWSALMSDSCRVEVSGLTLSVMPCFSSSLGEDLTTMTDSLFFGSSMSNSMQMAEEVMRGGPVDGESEGGRGGEGEGGRAAFEGMEALARAIETVLSQVQIELTDTVVQLVCHSQDYTHQYFVRVKVQSTKFYDELRGRSGGSEGEESSVDGPSQNDNKVEETIIRPTAVETKILELSNVSVEVGGVGEDIHTSTMSPEELPGVPVACISGVVNVSVKVRGAETSSVIPRVQVEAVVGGVHCLLAPAQLHILTEVAANLQRGKGSKSNTFEQAASTGINRPIPTKQLHGMESQLRQHYSEERKRKEHQRDLLRADPYQNSMLGNSRGQQSGREVRDSAVINSPDMFYSLNLQDSFSESTSTRSEFSGERSMESSLCTTVAASSTTMGDSYISMRTHTTRHGVSPDSGGGGGYDHYTDDIGSDGMDSIPLGGGSGLQQLVVTSGSGSKSSTRDNSGLNTRSGLREGGGRREGISQQDLCKYSFTLSGITVAILQADPAYVHTTSTDKSSSNTRHSWKTDNTKPSLSSLDSSGLDPMCYLLEVAEVLRYGGVNRKEIKRQQERLAQALPLDHLLLWLSTVKTGVSMQGDTLDLQLTIASSELWEFLYSNTANLPHITTPVSAALLVELCEDIPLSQPCIRLNISSSIEQSTKKRYKQSCSEHVMSVNLSLTSPHFNVDPTLIERLQPLIRSFSSSPVSPRGVGGGGGRSGLSGGAQSQLKHSLYMTTSNYHTINLQRQAVFNQAVSSNDNHHKSEQRINIKITTSSASLSFRFPVPELSESQRRLPWYHPSLRQEVLHVTLSHITLTSTQLPHLPHNATVYDAHFTHADVYLSCDGSVEGRELFLTVGKRGSVAEQSSPFYGPGGTTSDGNRTKIQLVVQPVSENVLDQMNKLSAHPPTSHLLPSHPHMFDDLVGLGGGAGIGTDDDDYEGRNIVYEPSPFSNKKDMYSGKGGSQVPEEENTTSQEHTEHLVTPGNRSEMEEFERYSSSLSQYYLSLHLPIVCLHLPSKKFLETLYSRFATDLALWRPATPEQVERTNAAKSLFFSSVDIQPAATAEEKVQMFKSVLKENEEEGDDEDIAHEFLLSPPSTSSTSFPHPTMGLSQLALSVSIDTAHISMLLHIREDKEFESTLRGTHSSNSGTNDSPRDSLYSSALSEPLLLDIDSVESERDSERGNEGSTVRTTGENGRKHNEIDRGLAVVELSTLHFYLVSGYRGDCNHDYVCAYVDQFSILHTGSLHTSGVPQYSAVINSACQDTTLSRLHHIVQTTPERLRVRSTLSGSKALSQPMILIAMDIRLEPERNSKTNKCAIALQNTLINHYVTPSQLSCFKQLGDFLSLSEETVEGYESPSLITEMHLHLQEFRLEYCPLHLPLSALLGVSSVQLSTSLVAGSPLLVVRILVDHTHLALAADTQQKQHSPTLRNDYVCVLDLDWFELTLRLCNTAQFEEESHKLFSHLPEVSLECSSNVLQIHTCMDSFIALRDLLVYLASDGDLQTKPMVGTKAGYSSLGSPQSSLGGNTPGIDNTYLATSQPTPSSSSSVKPSSSTSNDIDDLISDAMEDSQTTVHTLTPSSSVHSSINDSQCVSPTVDGDSGVSKSRSKMQVVEHGERSLDIDFGDSDDESERQNNERRVGRHDDNMTTSGADIVADLMAASQEIDDDVISGRGLRGKIKERSELDEDGFCILDAPTTTYVAPGSKPVVKCLLPEGETWRIMENHFAIPEHHVDQFQRPKHFPEPILQYTLKELTIVWHPYGGHDFSPPSPAASPNLPHRNTNSSSSTHHSSRPTHFTTQSAYSPTPHSGSKQQVGYVSGGRGKKTTMEGGGRGGWSMIGGRGRDNTIHMEIEIDKLRLQYETFPRDSTQSSRVVFLVRDLEIRDRLAQSNINKFLYQYATESMPRQSNTNMVSLKVLTIRPELEVNPDEEEVSIRLSVLPIRLNIDQDSFYFLFEFFSQVSDTSSHNSIPVSQTATTCTTDTSSQPPPSHITANTSSSPLVFIRSFVFQPALPIKIDYTTKWRFPTDTMGTLPGILISLYHLDNSELTLKSLNCKTGFLGWDSLLECVTHEWSTDIMSRQLPLILKGVGPTHYITQFVHGVVDLVRLPYHQYQEDGRIVWGLQQGASSFSTSTGVAVVELTSRTLETLQSVAQMVYDLVTPVPVEGHGGGVQSHQRKAPHQPQDFREGVSNAYDVVTAGLTGTAVDLYAVASQEHEERGVTGAVGGILRQIPGTVVKPVILLSEATRHVLGGVKNQFVPDARKEAKEKWKTIETND